MFNKGQLAGLMKKAQDMQKNVERAQAEVAALESEGVAGGGAVKVLISGKHDIKKLEIDDSVMDDKEFLCDLIMVAINDANRKLEAVSSAIMSKATPNMPAGMGLPF